MNKRTYHLMVSSLDAFDLKAAEAGLAALGFDVRLAADAGALSIHASGLLPGQSRILQFTPLTALLRNQITSKLAEDDEPVPPLLSQPEVLVATTEDDTDATPQPELALHWTLLGELLATAPDAARVVLYDPEWNSAVPHDEAREMMDWKDLLEEIELDRQLFATDEDEAKRADEHDRVEAMKAAARAHEEQVLLADLAPGQQPDGLRYGAVLAGLAATAALVAWFVFRRGG